MILVDTRVLVRDVNIGGDRSRVQAGARKSPFAANAHTLKKQDSSNSSVYLRDIFLKRKRPYVHAYLSSANQTKTLGEVKYTLIID